MSVTAHYGLALMCNLLVANESATWAENSGKFIGQGAASSEPSTFWRVQPDVPLSSELGPAFYQRAALGRLLLTPSPLGSFFASENIV